MKLQKMSILVVFILMFTSYGYAADKTLVYHYFDEATKDVKEVHTITINNLADKQTEIIRRVDANDIVLEDKMIIDNNGNTLEWTVEDDELGLKYTGKQKDGKLFLKGTDNGEEFEKEIDVDGRPFYFTPKYNLVPFAASPTEEMKFWMLRKDELTRYLMQAKKKKMVTIDVNGKEVEAIKVYYSATGIAERFYKRDYYFRPDDGTFLKKTAPKKADSLTAELVEEK